MQSDNSPGSDDMEMIKLIDFLVPSFFEVSEWWLVLLLEYFFLSRLEQLYRQFIVPLLA
jgi:hypothetical protein